MSLAAGIVVFRRKASNTEFLLLLASYADNHWSPPKGHVEGKESLLDTALRETREECGLRREHLQFTEYQESINYNVEGKPKTVVYWLAQLVDPDAEILVSDEHLGYKWVAVEEACRLVNFPPLIGLLRNCQSFLNRTLS